MRVVKQRNWANRIFVWKQTIAEKTISFAFNEERFNKVGFYYAKETSLKKQRKEKRIEAPENNQKPHNPALKMFTYPALLPSWPR